MRRYLFLLIILLLIAAPLRAQSATPEPDTKWWWAWREATQELIAFNADGETNVIATGVTTINHIERVSSNTALVVFESNAQFALYKLSSQSATRLSNPAKGSFIPLNYASETFNLIAIQFPYAFILTLNQDVWIINLNTDNVEYLDRTLDLNDCGYVNVFGDFNNRCIQVSSDGRYLDYVAPSSSEETHALFVLRERELATGVEYNFYVMPDMPDANKTHADCQFGGYGEPSLCYRHSEFKTYALNVHWLVNFDGQTRTLEEESQHLNTGNRWNVYYSRDDLIIQDAQCQQACSIAVYPAGEQVAQVFNFPDTIQSNEISNIVPLDNGNLLIYEGRDYILKPSGELQELGADYCCEFVNTASPDYHWIVLDTSLGSALWDLQTDQVKTYMHGGSYPGTLYRDTGFIISVESEDPNHYLSYVYFKDADNHLEIPVDANGSFTDMLPDHKLLYEQREDGTDLTTGIYRYNVETSTYTPLVPGATFQFGY